MNKFISRLAAVLLFIASTQVFAGAQGDSLHAFLGNFSGRWQGAGDATVYNNFPRHDYYNATVFFDPRGVSSWDLTSHLSGGISATTITSFRVLGDDLLIRAEGDVEQRAAVQSVDAGLLRFSIRRYNPSTGRSYDFRMIYGFNAQGGFFARTQAYEFGRLIMEDQITLDRF